MDNKSSLLASLTGDAPAANGIGDQDLFGDVAIDDTPVANGAGAAPAPASNGVAVPPPAVSAPSASSLLSKSGLLGMAGGGGGSGGDDLFGGGGGGMFDEVDQEQAEQERKAAEAAAAAAAEEQRRKEEAERAEQERIQKEQEAEQQRQAQLQQQQQMQQQQQQQQQQYGQPPQQHQPMYGQQQQQQPMTQPQSFQQRSTMMQQPNSLDQSQMIYDQMQTVSLGMSGVVPPNNSSAQFTNQQQPQQQQFQQPPSQMQQPNMISYRNHSGGSVANSTVSGVTNQVIPANPPLPSNAYSGGFASRSQQNNAAASGSYYYGTQQQQQQHQVQPHSGSPSQRMMAQRVGTTTAGMHNPLPPSPYGNSRPAGSLGQVPRIVLSKPPPVQPLFTKINVSEPMLIQSSSFFLAAAPYWSYQISTQLANNGGIWLVRRRFRHVVALEDRMRQACPGSILPPRPDKHATRALEEASSQQSAEFAVQRAAELQVYLTRLAAHPIAGQSNVLRLFLGLQDDVGTAWAEVSPNALTRLTAVGAGVGNKVAESTSSSVNLLPWKDGNAGPSASPASGMPAQDLEDNAELLALQSAEALRMGAVLQAVPKLEGAVALCRDMGDSAGALGMELNKFSKTTENTTGADDSWSKSAEVLSTGLLRHGRRTKRLALELSAAMEPFVLQHKLCRYEKLAFHDRRQALQRRTKERFRADSRASQLYQQQQRQMQAGPYGSNQLDQLQRSAVFSDDMAIGAMHDADTVANTLRWEINRVSYQRRKDWHASMKVVASSFKEASTERAAIWQATYDAFAMAFPDLNLNTGAAAATDENAAASLPVPASGGIAESVAGTDAGSVVGSVSGSVVSNPVPPQL